MIPTIAILGALLSGLATAIGAIPIYFKKDFSKKFLDMGLGFSAGIMLVAAFVSLILPGLASAKEVYSAHWALPVSLTGLFLGYLFIIFIHDILPHQHLVKNEEAIDKINSRSGFTRMSLIVFAIALHNVPEGLAVGVGFGTGNTSIGLSIAIAIAIQNIPEGLVVALGFLSEGSTKNKAFAMALLSGLVEPLAALVGYLSSAYSKYSLPFAFEFSAGAMLFVICQEILPELFHDGHERNSTLGFITGIITMLAINNYFL